MTVPGAKLHRSALVIDDDPLVAEAMVFQLRPEFDVRSAGSTQAALRLLEERVPDLVICDLYIGDETVYQLLVRIWTEHESTHLILHTSAVSAEWQFLLDQGVVQVVLRKPAAAAQVRKAVALLLPRRVHRRSQSPSDRRSVSDRTPDKS